MNVVDCVAQMLKSEKKDQNVVEIYMVDDNKLCLDIKRFEWIALSEDLLFLSANDGTNIMIDCNCIIYIINKTKEDMKILRNRTKKIRNMVEKHKEE